ncbi:hypothetical protein HJC23_004120 [Cyclotella cryptica]|uniref:Sodium/calcium exchanger membrane region domain-containing protein n=1 Tax=Cyclotella cryptica TaxID=29204 RepID=A0ABD3P9G0_9STRA
MSSSTVHFEGLDDLDAKKPRPSLHLVPTADSQRSLMTAPPAPPEQHRRTSLTIRCHSDSEAHHRRQGSDSGGHMVSFGGVSRFAAFRSIRRAEKIALCKSKGWEYYDPYSHEYRFGGIARGVTGLLSLRHSMDGSIVSREESVSEATSADADEETALIGNRSQSLSKETIPEVEGTPLEALKEMFTGNKINVLFIFLPFAYLSHAHEWNDGSIFILNFLAMVPLASMLGLFTEELAAHTNDVIGGLINATFGNAVELVVAIQALLVNDYRVVQASLIGSVFSNLLLVLGMCFFVGGLKHKEQTFIALGAVASIALLGLSGLTLYLPQQFADNEEDVVTISRIGAIILIVMYAQLLFFQLKTHAHIFNNGGDDGEDGEVALIPFSWALTGLVVVTAIVTVLSEFLVGSIDGFCEEFHLGRSFVGVIILPVVGNAVEHISAVSVAYKNKMDLALGGKGMSDIEHMCTLFASPLFYFPSSF